MDTTGKSLCAHGVKFEQVSKFKLQGVWIDENLEWDSHVTKLDYRIIQNRYGANSAKDLIAR